MTNFGNLKNAFNFILFCQKNLRTFEIDRLVLVTWQCDSWNKRIYELDFFETIILFQEGFCEDVTTGHVIVVNVTNYVLFY